MKRKIIATLWHLCLVLLLTSCSQDSVTSSSSQVALQEVNFSFFENSISDIGTRGESGTDTSLKDSRSVNYLEVALFPQNKEVDSVYYVRQDSTMESFGQFKVALPIGSYTIVAIAGYDKTLASERVKINAANEVVFPNGIVTDMFYASQTLTVTSGASQSCSSTLRRGVAELDLFNNLPRPDNMKDFICTVTGNCGNVFNPLTGHCLKTSTITRTYDASGEKHKGKRVHARIFLFLGEDDVSDVKFTTKAVDISGNTMKECAFDNVHLVKGKITTYSGPFFQVTTSTAFSIEDAKIADSGYGKTFE